MHWSNFFQAILSFTVVLALIYGIYWFVKRWSLTGGFVSKSKQPTTLHLIQTLNLDTKRRLVIVQRDNIQHVLLLGVGQDILIESFIPTNNQSHE